MAASSARMRPGLLMSMRMVPLLIVGALALQGSRALLLRPDAPEFTTPAPAQSVIRFETSKGNIDIEVTRAWAPLGADRFFNLVRYGYFDEARFFRVTAGRWVQFGINGDPAILFRDGQFLHREMRKERITEEELEAKIRANGHCGLDEVSSVYMESDGEVSVIPKRNRRSPSSTSSIKAGGIPN